MLREDSFELLFFSFFSYQRMNPIAVGEPHQLWHRQRVFALTSKIIFHVPQELPPDFRVFLVPGQCIQMILVILLLFIHCHIQVHFGGVRNVNIRMNTHGGLAVNFTCIAIITRTFHYLII